jgi:uncharacterized protein YukE
MAMAATTIDVQGVTGDISRSLKEIDAQDESLGRVAAVFDAMSEAWESETQSAYSRKFRRSRAQINAFNAKLKEYFQTAQKCVDECADTDSSVGGMVSSVEGEMCDRPDVYRELPVAGFAYARAPIIRFDSEYMRGYAKDTVERARSLIEEAKESLERAKGHSAWNCPERDGINDKLRYASGRIDSFNNLGIVGLSSALTRGADRFDEWERNVSAKESDMSAQLKRTWGFEAAVWNKDGRGAGPGPGLPNPLPIRPPIHGILPILPVPVLPPPFWKPIRIISPGKPYDDPPMMHIQVSPPYPPTFTDDYGASLKSGMREWLKSFSSDGLKG